MVLSRDCLAWCLSTVLRSFRSSMQYFSRMKVWFPSKRSFFLSEAASSDLKSRAVPRVQIDSIEQQVALGVRHQNGDERCIQQQAPSPSKRPSTLVARTPAGSRSWPSD